MKIQIFANVSTSCQHLTQECLNCNFSLLDFSSYGLICITAALVRFNVMDIFFTKLKIKPITVEMQVAIKVKLNYKSCLL